MSAGERNAFGILKSFGKAYSEYHNQREREAHEYAEKMQLTLAKCPGFIGCDSVSSEQGRGRIVVEPGRVTEAYAWLRRRFHTSENLELSDNGLCIELKQRVRNKSGCANRGKRVSVSFGKPKQFELALTPGPSGAGAD